MRPIYQDRRGRAPQGLRFAVQRLSNKCAVFAKGCDDSRGRLCHLSPMDKDSLAILEARLPTVEDCWLPWLNEEPHVTPLALPSCELKKTSLSNRLPRHEA